MRGEIYSGYLFLVLLSKKTIKAKVYWTILPKKGMVFSYNEQYFNNMKHNIDIIDKRSYYT